MISSVIKRMTLETIPHIKGIQQLSCIKNYYFCPICVVQLSDEAIQLTTFNTPGYTTTRVITNLTSFQWMPIEEYAALPFVQKHGLFKYIKDLCLVKAERNYPGFTPVPITSFFDASMSFLYCNKDGLDQDALQVHL